MARPPTAVVVANLGERGYVLPQVRDPALAPTTYQSAVHRRKKVSPGNLFGVGYPSPLSQGTHVEYFRFAHFVVEHQPAEEPK